VVILLLSFAQRRVSEESGTREDQPRKGGLGDGRRQEEKSNEEEDYAQEDDEEEKDYAQEDDEEEKDCA
jgi:hypothetical protein